METVGNIKAQQASGPEKVMNVRPSADAQERVKAQDKGPKSEAPPQKPPQLDEEKIQRIAEAMDNYVKSVQRDLSIRVDHDSEQVVVKVLSRETGEVIREIPSEEVLRLAARMEEMAGVFLNESV